MSLEAVKKREEQATAELKAKNEELQSQVRTLEKQLGLLEVKYGDYWRIQITGGDYWR